MPRIELEIPLVPPSNNQLLRQHWGERKRHKKKVLAPEIFHALASRYGSPLPPMANEPRYVEIIVRRPGVKRDHDNLTGGGKYLLDCLVEQGLLVDDSPEWLIGGKPHYSEERAKKKSTLIIIKWGEDEAA